MPAVVVISAGQTSGNYKETFCFQERSIKANHGGDSSISSHCKKISIEMSEYSPLFKFSYGCFLALAMLCN